MEQRRTARDQAGSSNIAQGATKQVFPRYYYTLRVGEEIKLVIRALRFEPGSYPAATNARIASAPMAVVNWAVQERARRPGPAELGKMPAPQKGRRSPTDSALWTPRAEGRLARQPTEPSNKAGLRLSQS